MRINQYLAHQLGVSRRQGDELVKKGSVKIDNKMCDLFDKVESGNLVEYYDPKKGWIKISEETNFKTLLFYKPIFTVTTRSDEFKRKTIYSFLKSSYFSFKPAGRLDYLSEGLLVLSQDGDLINKLTHPSFETEKRYLISLKEDLRPDQVTQMERGMTLGEMKLQPVKIVKKASLKDWEFLKPEPKHVWYEFALKEGKNNQIRQMCEYFGQKVLRLIRIQHGQYLLTEQLYKEKMIRLDDKVEDVEKGVGESSEVK